ncbi:hypothetical protein H9L39_09389 [Fusarium oxysporum f. sp. albedinis]|nr:hypothetical protein H9L39_09389 [Fusarium oxysporum f. sp. albedinis]
MAPFSLQICPIIRDLIFTPRISLLLPERITSNLPLTCRHWPPLIVGAKPRTFSNYPSPPIESARLALGVQERTRECRIVIYNCSL